MEHVPLNGAPRILLVEDDAILLACAAGYLLSQGYPVDCAENAGEAMALLDAHHSYAAVVTDLELPLYARDNGFDVIRHASRLVPRPVILLWTGAASAEVEREALASGADACLEKSTLRDLLAALVTHVGSSEPHCRVTLPTAERCETAEGAGAVAWGVTR
jgi:CheY-like chemotaxis protein